MPTTHVVHGRHGAMGSEAHTLHSSHATTHIHALAMDHVSVFAMHHMSVVCMHGCVARAVRSAHELAKVQPEIMCNFSPAFTAVEFADDHVEALTRRISYEVCVLQSPPAKPSRCPF